MPLDEERGQRITPDLIKWLRELRSIGSSIMLRPAYRTDDDLLFMALCFVAKQLDHIESIRRLVPSKDTGLVARTMLEGMAQLYWAYEEPLRSSRWRAPRSWYASTTRASPVAMRGSHPACRSVSA